MLLYVCYMFVGIVLLFCMCEDCSSGAGTMYLSSGGAAPM